MTTAPSTPSRGGEGVVLVLVAAVEHLEKGGSGSGSQVAAHRAERAGALLANEESLGLISVASQGIVPGGVTSVGIGRVATRPGEIGTLAAPEHLPDQARWSRSGYDRPGSGALPNSGKGATVSAT